MLIGANFHVLKLKEHFHASLSIKHSIALFMLQMKDLPVFFPFIFLVTQYAELACVCSIPRVCIQLVIFSIYQQPMLHILCTQKVKNHFQLIQTLPCRMSFKMTFVNNVSMRFKNTQIA